MGSSIVILCTFCLSMSDTNLNLLNIKEQALQLTAQGDSVVSKIEQELYEMLVVKKDSIAF